MIHRYVQALAVLWGAVVFTTFIFPPAGIILGVLVVFPTIILVMELVD